MSRVHRQKKNELLESINELNFILEPFYRIDFRKITELQKMIRKLENEINMFYNQYETELIAESLLNNSQEKNTEKDMIGILPKLLFSKEIFKTNEEIIVFSNKMLNTNIDNKSKKPRSYLIGNIMNHYIINKKEENKELLINIKNYIDDKAMSTLNSQEFFKEWDKIIGKNKND